MSIDRCTMCETMYDSDEFPEFYREQFTLKKGTGFHKKCEPYGYLWVTEIPDTLKYTGNKADVTPVCDTCWEAFCTHRREQISERQWVLECSYEALMSHTKSEVYSEHKYLSDELRLLR